MADNNRVGLDDILAKDKLEVSSHIYYRKEYRELSSDAKLIYQYILKRFSISELNYTKAIEENTIEDFTFVDENNNVFCFVSNDELRFVLHISEKTVIKAKKELKLVNLLEEVKQTANKHNRLYLNRIELNLQDKKSFKTELNKFKSEEKNKRLLKNSKRKKKEKNPSAKPKKQDQKQEGRKNNSEPQILQFIEPQNLQFMNRKIYRQSTLEFISTLESFSTYKNLKPNQDIYNILWNIKIPKELKIRIKVMLKNKTINLSIVQLLEIENAYHHQIQKENVVPDCEFDNQFALNDKQFSDSVTTMFEKVPKIDSIKGLIDSWVNNAIDYKNQEFKDLTNNIEFKQDSNEYNRFMAFKELMGD